MKKGWIIKIFVGILLLILNSCDIPGRLVIKNETKGYVKFRYYYKSNNADTLSTSEISLSNKKNENKYLVYYGLGQFWTDERIKQYITDIERVDIITLNDSITVEGKDCLYDFFKKRRKGIFDSEMNITIK